MKYSIKDLRKLVVATLEGDSTYGTNQEWFPTVWQRMAGCGPSVAGNLLLYHGRSGRFNLPIDVKDQESLILLMEYTWKHITPGVRGVNKTSMFYEGLETILEERGSNLEHISLNVNKDKGKRPTLEQLSRFIRIGLESDSPLAFLNLSSGTVKDLEDWHWMTCFALEESDDGRQELSLSNNGILQTIDLGVWLETSSLGGGFVYLSDASLQQQ